MGPANDPAAVRRRWLGHATVVAETVTARLAVDPWRWRDEDLKADLVLVTHGHADHCSEDDLAAASHAGTIAAGPAHLAPRLARIYGARYRTLAAGEAFDAHGFRVTALPAEGPPRAVGFHPRGDGLAYVVDVAGERILFLGDSAALAEHEGLRADVVYVAVGGLAVMDPDEASLSAARIAAGVAVPVHWGDLNGRYDLAVRFAERCAALGVRVELPSAPL